MSFYEIITMVVMFIIVYAVLVLMTTYAKWVIRKSKQLKVARTTIKLDQYGKKVELTRSTLGMIDMIIQQLVLTEFQKLDDEKGIQKTNTSHYKKLLERISLEIRNCLEFDMKDILMSTLIDQKFLEYYIIRHTEIYLKQALKAVIGEDEPFLDVGEDNG